MKKMSIKTSILLPVLFVLIAGIFIMVITIGSVSSSTTNNLSNQLVSARVNEYTNNFEAMCLDSYGSILSLAPVVLNLSDSMANPREEVIKILTDVLMGNENMLGIWTCWEPNAFDGKDNEYINTLYHDSTGRYIPYIYREGNGYDIAPLESYDVKGDGDYYLGARDSGKPYVTDPFEYNVGGTIIPLYSIAMPVIRDNTVVGVIGIDIRLDKIISVINEGSIMDEGYLFILSPEGLFATHPNSDLVLKSFETTWMVDLKSVINSMLSDGGNISHTAFSDQLNENINFLASSVMIGDTGRYWVVCGIIPERVVKETSSMLVWLVIISGLLLIVFVGLTIHLIIRNRLKELPIIIDTAESIAKGIINVTNMDSESGATKNEITQLSRAFDLMAKSVKSQADAMTSIAGGDYSISIPVRSDGDVMNKAINNMIDNTNQIMNEISASSAQVSTGSKQIADGSQSLAQGSTQQAVAVEQLSNSIAEIAQKTKNNAEMADQAAKLANTIMNKAEKGSKQMDDMMEAVKEISNAGQSISKVIKVIDDIAFQTNILALNASVEAARAGQHGKGFAVVAEEVRNLASKSAEAAKNTGELISESLEKAELGVNIADETSKSLIEIVTGINESGQLINEIAKSSEEQSLGISQINKGIDQVSQVVQQNSATAQESAASSEEMSGQAELLENLISQFKLKDDNTNYLKEFTNNVTVSSKRAIKLEQPSLGTLEDNNNYGKY